MRFPYPCFPAEFEIPDAWWHEAGMDRCTVTTTAYASSKPAAQIIPLREIEPPVRFPERPLDFHGFDRTRLIRLFAGFVGGAEIEPLKVFASFVTAQAGKREISQAKAFFFEKKKQKTFVDCRRHGVQTGEFSAVRNR